MDIVSKNRLQEYCVKNKLPLPNYRVTKQSGPSHDPRFEVDVEVNGQYFTSDDLYSSKKQAEQSAARRALQSITQTNVKSISQQFVTIKLIPDDFDPPPSYTEATNSIAIEHLSPEYSYIEQYISDLVGASGGRIRKIWPGDVDGLYKFEFCGGYRYCENIKTHHKKRTVYFMVDPKNKTYYQMCYDSQCTGFRSATKKIRFEPEAFENTMRTNSQDRQETSINNEQLLSKFC